MKLTDVYDWKRRGPGEMVSAWRVEVEEGTWRAITVPVMPLRNCVFLRAYRAIFREFHECLSFE